MKLTFWKSHNNEWYIDLPEWEGDQSSLEMVCGADALCDILSHNGELLDIEVTEGLQNETTVILHRWIPYKEEDGEGLGAHYRVDFENPAIQSFDIWLCPVTTTVLGCYPNVIYIK